MINKIINVKILCTWQRAMHKPLCISISEKNEKIPLNYFSLERLEGMENNHNLLKYNKY